MFVFVKFNIATCFVMCFFKSCDFHEIPLHDEFSAFSLNSLKYAELAEFDPGNRYSYKILRQGAQMSETCYF